MALKKNMKGSDIKDFLEKELIPQVNTEINGLIWPRKKHGAYFITVRQVLCMVDFLGAVYYGYPLSERKLDKEGRKISRSYKAIKFINEFFEPKSTYTQEVVGILYSMYRHGLVHLYQPRFIKHSSKKTIRWLFYRGKRYVKQMEIDSNIGKIKFNNVNHMQLSQSPLDSNTIYLPICVDALCEDFMDAINSYKDKVSKNKSLQRKWRTTVNAICKPRKI